MILLLALLASTQTQSASPKCTPLSAMLLTLSNGCKEPTKNTPAACNFSTPTPTSIPSVPTLNSSTGSASSAFLPRLCQATPPSPNLISRRPIPHQASPVVPTAVGRLC